MRIRATSMNRCSENFFRTAQRVHLSIPPSKMHMSFAHCLISYSEQLEFVQSSQVHTASLPCVIFLDKYIALPAIKDGTYLSMRCSIRGSSIKQRAKFHCFESAFAILLNLSRNLKADGVVILKSSFDSIDCSIYRISSLVYALSVIYTKSLTSGAQISSYFEAINIAVTPTNQRFVRLICSSSRYLSIRLTVMKRVSGSNLNLR